MMKSDPFESPGQLEENLGMFEAAAHSRPMELTQPTLKTIVAALDGSNQDDTVRGMAEILAGATSARCIMISDAAKPADILASCRNQHANLLIIPVPFGQDIGELKDESLGSVVDMLLLEAPCPVLCVRQLYDRETITALLADLLVPMTGADLPDSCRAAGWAFRVVQPKGHLMLLAVADEDAIAQLRGLLSPEAQAEVDPESLNRELTEEICSLAAEVQKRAAEADLSATVSVKNGRFIPLVLEAANEHPRLIVVGMTREHATASFHHATDLILGAKGPVLIV